MGGGGGKGGELLAALFEVFVELLLADLLAVLVDLGLVHLIMSAEEVIMIV